ncbi:hypothetical protein [Microbacterium lacticum]
MRYADILDDGTSLTAAGWIGPGASDDEQFLSPFRSGADNWVADSRLLPIDRKAPTLGRVVVHGVWAGERVKVDRITPDLSEPRAVMESRALRRLAERSYPQAEGHPWPTADFDRWVTTSLVGHPDALKVTHVSNGRSRVTVISTPAIRTLEKVIQEGPAGPVVLVHSRWDRATLRLAEASVEDLPEEEILEVGESVTSSGEISVHAMVVRHRPSHTALMSRYPDGLLSIAPWISVPEQS